MPASRRQCQSMAWLLEMHGFEAHSGSHASYSRDWRHAGGGALLRLAAHPIGAMLWLKREEGRRRDGRPIGVASVTAEVADLSAHPAITPENTRIARDWGRVESFGCVVITFEDGAFHVVGTDRSVSLQEVAKTSYKPHSLPPDIEVGLFATDTFAPGTPCFPIGCHVVEVEIDPETGHTELLRYSVVDDVGTVINKLTLEGQIHGGIGQAVGQAGDTGSLSGPRLYFEIRRGEAPLDPRKWLRARARGR